jgi:hypothetical protein
VQRTENGGDGEGNYQWNTRWGTTSPWCAPCASFSGEKRKEGGSGTGTRAEKKLRADEGTGKRGTYSTRGETSAAPRRGHASTAHKGLATDGFRRTRSDSDPASVERSPGTGATSHRCSKHSKLQES